MSGLRARRTAIDPFPLLGAIQSPPLKPVGGAAHSTKPGSPHVLWMLGNLARPRRTPFCMKSATASQQAEQAVVVVEASPPHDHRPRLHGARVALHTFPGPFQAQARAHPDGYLPTQTSQPAGVCGRVFGLPARQACCRGPQ